MYQDAATEAREALRLDGITHHPDKKLPDSVRKRLEAQLSDWAEKAASMKLPLEPQ
jgi:hypothetical protein